jgi:hypothetical protein
MMSVLLFPTNTAIADPKESRKLDIFAMSAMGVET